VPAYIPVFSRTSSGISVLIISVIGFIWVQLRLTQMRNYAKFTDGITERNRLNTLDLRLKIPAPMSFILHLESIFLRASVSPWLSLKGRGQMVKVMLVRHGETDWNREQVFRGRIDVELNRNGREQARALAEATRMFQIDAVYSSPLSRSLETARIVAEAHHLDVKIAQGFVDFHYGDWQGLKHQEVKEKLPDLYLSWHESPHLVQISGGESLDDVRRRSLKELKKIVTEHEGGTVMIVSHRVVNKVLLCAIMELDNSHFWRLRQDNCCLNIFECSEDEYTICLLNDICHLRQTTGSVLKADF